MEFFIKKGATMPYLELELIQDGIYDNNKFYDKLQNATATITMQNIKCGTKAIICRPVDIVDVCPKCNNCPTEYRLIYKFRTKDTKKVGRYEATIEITFLDGCGTLIIPIHKNLYVNVI